MANYRRGRINEEMQREVAKIIREVKDPRVAKAFISITGAEVTPDLKYAKIYYSAYNADKKEVKMGLKSSAGFIRGQVSKNLNLRITPELTFIVNAGEGFQTLPIVIYGMTKRTVTPDMYALSTLIFGSVLLLLVLSNVMSARQEKRAARHVTSGRGTKTTRIILLILVLAMLVALTFTLIFTGNGQEIDYLYIYNWGEYMPLGDEIEDGEYAIDALDLFEQYYEQETGRRLEIVYSIFASNEEMYAKLTNGASKIDLIIPSDYMVERLIADKQLAKLNFENIPNISNIADAYRAPNTEYDPNGEYSVPYTCGYVGLIYDTSLVDPADFENGVSWNILWDHKYAGKILTFNNSRDAFGIAQYILSAKNGATTKLNNYINTSDTARWDAALEMLKQQKPVVQAYVMDEVFNKMQSGAAAMAPYYAGDFYTMQEINPNLEFIYPEEGTNVFVDAFCIPATTNTPDRNKAIAEMFINFVLDTDVVIDGEHYNIAKDIAEYICYATPNEAVYNDPDYSFRDSETGALDPVLYPELTDYPTYYFSNLPPETLTYQNSLWEQLKISGGGDTGILSVYIATGAILLALAGFGIFIFVRKKKRAKFY